VKPAVIAMQEGLFNAPSDVPVHVAVWHGLTPHLWMTLGVIALGSVLYMTLAKWQTVYDLQPKALSLNAAYDALMVFWEKTMNKLSRLYMTGILRTYLIYMFGAIVVIVLATLFAKNAFMFNVSNFSPVNGYGLLTAVILTISVCMLLFAKKRMYAIVALGGVGYSVALLFIIYKAPDLALTQLVIETVTVALFLLAFHHLPQLKRHGETKGFRLGNFIVALGVGITMTLLALSANSQKLIPSISQFYKDTVLSEAGGHNIVNVILVDYRGFDTLFEIAVLAIAGIGVYSMIRLKLSREEKLDENK